MAIVILGLGLLAVPPLPAGAVQVFHDRIVSANPSDITPNIIDAPHENHQVLSIAQIGTRTYAAGEFTQIQNAGGGPVYTVNGIFAFFTATGQIDVNGFGFPHLARRIEVIAPSEDGSALFLGGGFTHIDGFSEGGVASLNPATGAVNTQFKVNANERVYDLVARGGSLYMGGMFTTVNGLPRSGIAAVNEASGAVSSELSLQVTGTRLDRKAMRVDNLDVTPDASRLIVTGNYTAVNGVPRGQVTMIDLTTSPDSLANWDTQRFTPLCATKFSTYIRDVDFSPDGSYLVIATTGATAINHGGTPTTGPICDGSARFETYATGSDLQPTWVNYVGGDTNYSVAITGTVVYLAGHERWQNNYFGADAPQPGSVRRQGIAAVSPVNGVPFAWNPGRTRGLGAQALLATSDGLFVGSDTDQIGGEFHAKLALMPLTGGEFVPPANPGTIPGELYTIQQDGTMVARTFDGTTFGSAVTRTSHDWSDVRGAFMLSGTLYTGQSVGTLRKQTLAGDKVGTAKTLNLHGLDTETQQPPD
ncbi:MAG: hypothetical protein QOE25_537, partial [Actinomycetota bacterium]|nr:hypothetical protein [Actinomycetota bacterium]